MVSILSVSNVSLSFHYFNMSLETTFDFSLRFLSFLTCFILLLCRAISTEPISDRPEAVRTRRTVETKSGSIRGVLQTSLLKGVDYYAFKGIPYAKAPTGDLRFRVSFVENEYRV